MGKFFNQEIMNMPNAEVRKRMKSVRVTVNSVFGQTKGYLEDMRRNFNEPEADARKALLEKLEKTQATPRKDELYEKRVAQMALAREAKQAKGRAEAVLMESAGVTDTKDIIPVQVEGADE